MTLPIGHPLFLQGGQLGLPGHQVLNALDPQEGQKRAALALATGIPAPAVGRALRRLHELGAALKASDGLWYYDISFDPDATAQRLGLQERMDRRNERMDTDETKHRAAVALAYQRHLSSRDGDHAVQAVVVRGRPTLADHQTSVGPPRPHKQEAIMNDTVLNPTPPWENATLSVGPREDLAKSSPTTDADLDALQAMADRVVGRPGVINVRKPNGPIDWRRAS